MMRFKGSFAAVLGFAAVTLIGTRAIASRTLSSPRRSGGTKASDMRRLSPFTFLVIGCVFLVFAIFAKYQEASGFYVLGFFMLTVLSVGVFLVMELTGQFLQHPAAVVPERDASDGFHR